MKKIVIVDYECGNIQSLRRAISLIGYESIFTDDHNKILEADYLFLPGVGSFKVGMQKLNEKNLSEVIKNYAHMSKPLMGICLGMQLLLEKSYEFGSHEGLGLVEGKVTPLSAKKGFKVPHIGWSPVSLPDKNKSLEWDKNLMKDITPNKDCYFVHSYMVDTKDRNNTIAMTNYGGVDFCSILKKQKIYGCQFHPEKSGRIGLKIIKNFLETV